MEHFKLPDGIGPHDFIEYELMAEGRKNIAMFSDLIPSAFVHNPCDLELGMLRSDDDACTIYYMPGHIDGAKRLMELNTNSRGAGYVPEVEREIGRLLGYEEWQIDVFLQHVSQST